MAKSKTITADLPKWNLSDLYSSPKSRKLKTDLDWIQTQSKKFRIAYEGKLKSLDGLGLGRAIIRYEIIVERTGKIISYGQLLHATFMSDPEVSAFFQNLQERVTEISSDTMFFTLEINRLSDVILKRQLKHPKAAHYAPWIRDCRAFRDHQLSNEVEKLLHEKSLTSQNAWLRLFGETMADIRFTLKGQPKKEITLADTLNLLSNKKSDQRERAAKALNNGLEKNIRTLALITNTLAKDKEIEDQWRRYPKPQSYRNLANQVEDVVVDALVEAVRSNYTN